MTQPTGGSHHPEPTHTARASQTNRPVRKQQITVRLDPGMIEDARSIALRRGVGYHTLLRMWVMEGITRAYNDGWLGQTPTTWQRAHTPPPAPRAHVPAPPPVDGPTHTNARAIDAGL